MEDCCFVDSNYNSHFIELEALLKFLVVYVYPIIKGVGPGVGSLVCNLWSTTTANVVL